MERQYQIRHRAGADSWPGHRGHGTGIADRGSGGGSEVCEADSAHPWPAGGRHRGSVLPHLWQDQDRPDRPGLQGRAAGGRLSPGHQGGRDGLRGERPRGGQRGRFGHSGR